MRIGAEFLARWYPQEGGGAVSPKTILMPTPTWGNHGPIAVDSGFQVGQYRYFDPKTNGLDFAGMTADLKVSKKGTYNSHFKGRS